MAPDILVISCYLEKLLPTPQLQHPEGAGPGWFPDMKITLSFAQRLSRCGGQ
jgi:hypothetical protein